MKGSTLIQATFLGLVLGLLAASTAVVVREGRASVARIGAPSPRPDSVRSATQGVAPKAAAAVQKAAAAKPVASAAAVPTPPRSPAADPPAPKRQPAGDAAPAPISTQQVAKLFASMAPRDAARVLERLSDEEVGTVLARMPERQASAILGNLSPERAAAISRRAIRSDGSTK